MPNIKSAKKRLRTSEMAHKRNVAVRTRVKTARRAFLEATAAKDKATSETAFKTFCSVIDNAAKKGLVAKNTAVRSKTRAAARLRALA